MAQIYPHMRTGLSMGGGVTGRLDELLVHAFCSFFFDILVCYSCCYLVDFVSGFGFPRRPHIEGHMEPRTQRTPQILRKIIVRDPKIIVRDPKIRHFLHVPFSSCISNLHIFLGSLHS